MKSARRAGSRYPALLYWDVGVTAAPDLPGTLTTRFFRNSIDLRWIIASGSGTLVVYPVARGIDDVARRALVTGGDATHSSCRRWTPSLQSSDQIAEEPVRQVPNGLAIRGDGAPGSRPAMKPRTGIIEMSRMFCTLKEAAETLNTSEDQINTLLERGILHEFRQGPHRLLREADIDALDLRREHRIIEAQPPAQPPVQTQRPSPRSGNKPRASRRPKREVRPCATAVARPARPQRTKNARRRTEDAGPRAQDARPKMENRPASPPVVHRPSSVVPATTVRQWFWMGLVQDRPTAIALLSGLVLLALSALAAGICLVAEGL